MDCEREGKVSLFFGCHNDCDTWQSNVSLSKRHNSVAIFIGFFFHFEFLFSTLLSSFFPHTKFFLLGSQNEKRTVSGTWSCG